MNGLISFNQTITSYDIHSWPNSTYDLPASFLAAFWADSNGFYVGQIQYMQATDGDVNDTLKQYVADKRQLEGFNANYIFVGEWKDITPCGCFFPVSKATIVQVRPQFTKFFLIIF